MFEFWSWEDEFPSSSAGFRSPASSGNRCDIRLATSERATSRVQYYQESSCCIALGEMQTGLMQVKLMIAVVMVLLLWLICRA